MWEDELLACSKASTESEKLVQQVTSMQLLRITLTDAHNIMGYYECQKAKLFQEFKTALLCKGVVQNVL